MKIKEKKDFLFKLLLFILLFWGMSKIVNVVFIDQVLAYTNIYRADKQFQQKKENIDILIAGDSHPRADVNPTILPNTFVVATGGESIIQTYYRLRYYIEEDKLNIKLVILPLDIHSFSSFRTDRIDEVDWWNKYIDYIELGLYKHELFSCLHQWMSGEFAYLNGIKLTRYVILVNSGLERLNQINDGHMTGNNNFLLNQNPTKLAKQRVRSHIKNFIIVDDVMVHYFFKTIDLLESNNIKVVLVKYPITNNYYWVAEKEMDISGYYRQVGELINSHGYSLLILDYQDIYWSQKDMFNDADHLNLNGAINFTNILKQDLEKNGLLTGN